MITAAAVADAELDTLAAGPESKAKPLRVAHSANFPGIQPVYNPKVRQIMKKQQSIRLRVENLEQKTLLSAGVGPHSPERPQMPSVVVDVARPPVHLMGYVYSGNGTVSPMGGVQGSINLAQKTVTLRNGSGSVRVKLTQVHKYGPTITARAYQIMKGTGQFKSFRGHGHTSLTAVKVGGRLSVWTESFYP
jgi:hypothetical protein